MADVHGIEFRNGIPIKIEPWASTEAKNRWSIVRSDSYDHVKGDIVSANVETGDLSLSVIPPGGDAAETKAVSLGPNGFRIVRR